MATFFCLKGLAHFLDYVRHGTSSSLVADLGAGEAVGITQLAKHRMGAGLGYVATGIVVPQGYDSDRTKVPYLRTGAETLAVIKSGSLGGAVAVHSIIFSAAPDMVVESLNRVLVAGGVIKTNLVLNQSGSYVPSSQVRFKPEFEGRGFDVAVADKVLLAIKPGGTSSISADALLQADLRSYQQQRQEVGLASLADTFVRPEL